MAKLTNLPSLAVINGHKGIIDYYIHDGVPCARRWPRSPGRRRAAAVEAQWPAFSWTASYWNHLSLEVRQAYKDLATSTNMTPRDLFTKSVINGTTLYLDDI